MICDGLNYIFDAIHEVFVLCHILGNVILSDDSRTHL